MTGCHFWAQNGPALNEIFLEKPYNFDVSLGLFVLNLKNPQSGSRDMNAPFLGIHISFEKVTAYL